MISLLSRIGLERSGGGLHLKMASPSSSMKFYTIKARNMSNPDKDDNVSSSGEKESPENEERRIPFNGKDEEIANSQILGAALKYVNTKGWTMDAIRAGAEEVYSAGEIGEIFMEYDLVNYFIQFGNHDLETHLKKNQLNLHQALEYRLLKVTPYGSRFSEALAHAVHPNNVTKSAGLLLRLADSVAHHSLKDVSADLTWYTKRLGIASIYAASELCLVQDKSPFYKNTFDFLKRRVAEFEQFSTGQGSIPIPEVFSASFTTVLNMLGRNVSR